MGEGNTTGNAAKNAAGNTYGDTVPETRIGPEAWSAALADVEGPQIVVGGPGTGKTEFLVRRVAHLIEGSGIDPGSLLLLSFSRRGVADLRQRITTSMSGSHRTVDISTFHSFARRLLESNAQKLDRTSTPQLLTGPEQVALVRELLAEEDPSRWPLTFRGMLGSVTFSTEVANFLMRCRDLLLDPKGLAELAAERDDWRALPGFFAVYERVLRAKDRLDYGGLLAAAVHLLDDEEAFDAIDHHYKFVLVDEYQDTTIAQAKLLERLTRRHRNLTAAADPYQSIYSFRGAAVENVHRFPEDFRDSNGAPATRVVLTTSLRVPAEILDAAVRVTSHELPGSAGKVTPAAGEGTVETFRFEQQTEEAEWIADEVLRLHLGEGVPFSSMGVFVRSKQRFLPELSRALHRRGVPHDTPDSRLSEHPAVRFVLDCVTAATTPDSATRGRALRRILLGPLFSVRLGELRDVERSAARDGWAAAVRSEVPSGGPLAGLLDDPSWATTTQATDGFWRLWSDLPQLDAVVSTPHRREERAAWATLAQVLERWAERNPDATLDDYRRLTEEEEFEAQPLLSYQAPEEDRITLTTLHQSKGLEFDYVFIADAVEGVFPDLRSRDSLLGVRHLLPQVPTARPDYVAFRLQEERRLAYTAMTRARRRLVWTTTATGFDEGAGLPSRFLALVAGTTTVDEALRRPDAQRDPVTPSEAEAALRRQLVDPGAAAPHRLAALATLANGREWGMRSPLDFTGVKEQGPDGGLIGDDLRLSPSQAESYDACPRRYVFERRLRVDDRTSIHAQFGSLIHDTLERAERAALERGEPHATLEEAIVVLETLFDPQEYGGEPYAPSWWDRAVDALERLYGAWPSEGEIVALEHPLELTLDGTPWVGRADRVERVGDVVRIVDYKTTRNPPTKSEVASSPQLGFYLLAAMADPAITAVGEPREAEMWFPSRQTQTVPTSSFDFANIADVEARLIDIARGIRQEDWQARINPGCRHCRVRLVCPEWPEGKGAYES